MMMSDITKTPREELECKKKYLYEHSRFWECNDGSKCQILEDDVCDLLNEQQATIKQLEEDKAIAEDYANIFEKENVKLRKKLNNYKATVLGFVWIMEQNGRISGKDDKVVKDLFKLINDE